MELQAVGVIVKSVKNRVKKVAISGKVVLRIALKLETKLAPEKVPKKEQKYCQK